MADAKAAVYRRLPGRGIRRSTLYLLGSSCSLWQGDDHLLLVDNNGVREGYRRFFFKDIQALIIQKTNAAVNTNMAAGAVLLASAGLWLLRGMGGGFLNWLIVFISVSSLIILLTNLIMGPSCTTRIITAVQDEDIPPLRRVRNAIKVKAVIDRACTLRQGVLSEQDILSRPVPARHSASKPGVQETLKPFIGRYHTLTFALVLAQGAFLGLDILRHFVFFNYIQIALGAAVSILVILALLKQQGSDAPSAVKTMLWTTIAFICISTLTIFGANMPMLMDKAILSQHDMYKAMASMSPTDSVALYWCYVGTFAGYAFLGTAGLFVMMRQRGLDKGA